MFSVMSRGLSVSEAYPLHYHFEKNSPFFPVFSLPQRLVLIDHCYFFESIPYKLR